MEIKNLGEKLISLRKEKNLTQKDMANKLNVSSQLVSKWENNQAIPSLEYVADICKIFDITINELVHGEKVVTNKPKLKVKKKFVPTKPFIISMISICTVVLVTCFAFFCAYCFIPNVSKDKYLADINNSIDRYLDEGYFDIVVTGKLDGSTQLSETYQGYVDENGITYRSSGDAPSELIVEGIKYTSSYKTEYINEGNIVTVEDLFLEKAFADTDSEITDLTKKDIKYLRKTKNGYYIEIRKSVLEEELTDDERDMINFKSNLNGEIIIKNGKFQKMEISVIMRNMVKEENFLIESSIEFKHEKPSITANETLPWKADNTISTDSLVTIMNGDKTVNKLTISEETTSLIYTHLQKNNYYIYNNKIWLVDYVSGLGYYIKGFDVNTLEELENVELYNYDHDIGLFYENYYVFYGENTIYRVDLDLNDPYVSTYYSESGASFRYTYHIYNNYLCLISNVSYDNYKLYIFNITASNYSIKLSKSFSNKNSLTTYSKDKYIYILCDGEYFTDYDYIYRYDITTGAETALVSKKGINSIVYVSDSGNVYYDVDTVEVDETTGIYKAGSDFKYEHYFSSIEEKDGLLYIYYSNSLAYVYDGTTYLGAQEITTAATTIYDEDIVYIADNNDIYIKGESKVYHGSYDDYTSINAMYINGSRTPTILDCDGENILVQFQYYGNISYIGLYRVDDLTRAVAVASITDTTYYETEIMGNNLVYIDGTFYMISA